MKKLRLIFLIVEYVKIETEEVTALNKIIFCLSLIYKKLIIKGRIHNSKFKDSKNKQMIL